jgi:FixJ family two-component response regulator
MRRNSLTDSVELIAHTIESETNLTVRGEAVKTLIAVLSTRLTDIIGELVWQRRERGDDFAAIAADLGISERAAIRVWRRYKRLSGRTHPLSVVDREGFIDISDLMNVSGRKARHRRPEATVMPLSRKGREL